MRETVTRICIQSHVPEEGRSSNRRVGFGAFADPGILNVQVLQLLAERDERPVACLRRRSWSRDRPCCCTRSATLAKTRKVFGVCWRH